MSSRPIGEIQINGSQQDFYGLKLLSLKTRYFYLIGLVNRWLETYEER